jgi:hypothetical protein
MTPRTSGQLALAAQAQATPRALLEGSPSAEIEFEHCLV